MGLSIFYSGTLRNTKLLPSLLDEITDICDDLHWPWEFFHPTPELPLHGVIFRPPGAQNIFLTFLADGRLAEPNGLFNLSLRRIVIPKPGIEILLNPIVQYAGPDAHIQLISIFRYLSTQYFSSFYLSDESEYWETGDAQKCRDWFAMFSVWMDNMSTDLGKLDNRGYEGGGSYHARLMDLLRSGRSPLDILKVLGNPYRKT